MANTIDFILTNSASDLISKVLSGKTLNFTRMAVGDGFSYDTTVAKGYTTLVNEMLSIDITKKETLTPSSVKVTSAFKNTDAQKEFYYREVGLYAQDPDTGKEVLYAYGNRNDAAELITPTGSNVITKQLAFIISVGDSANVTFNVNTGVYALQEDIQTLQTSLQELDRTKANIKDYYNNEQIRGCAIYCTNNDITYYKPSLQRLKELGIRKIQISVGCAISNNIMVKQYTDAYVKSLIDLVRTYDMEYIMLKIHQDSTTDDSTNATIIADS